MFASLLLDLRLSFLILLSVRGNVFLMPVIEDNLDGLGLVTAFLKDGGFALFVNMRDRLPGSLPCFLQLLTSLLEIGFSEGFLMRSELRWGNL